jgi:hypothetical protein
MSDIREIINPSDKITINCDDLDAARLAVVVLSQGWHCIKDDAMPVLALCDENEWAKQTYNKTLQEWADSISIERMASALESVANVGERTSMNDIVGTAQKAAKRLRERMKKESEPK